MKKITWFGCALTFMFPLAATAASLPDGQCQWLKGNTHTHTTESDGKHDLQEVVRHYRALGFDFLAVTDHNRVTSFDGVETDGLLLIPGAENSARLGRHHIHVNGLGTSRSDGIPEGGRLSERVTRSIAAIEDQGGLAILNHPTMSLYLPKQIREVPNVRFVEVHNQNFMWDDYDEWFWSRLLSDGKHVYGIAADDFHVKSWRSNGAFIMVCANSPTVDGVLAAMHAGNFYASTGIRLELVRNDPEAVSVRIASVADEVYLIRFLGKGNRVLKAVLGTEAVYYPTGAEGFVRVKVQSLSGRQAWTQPVFF